MSLYYPDAEQLGKTGGNEDRFVSVYEVLDRPGRIVERITFESADVSFAEEMIMETVLREKDGDTEVTISFENLPDGISAEDNDEGTRSSLAKLARFIEVAQGD